MMPPIPHRSCLGPRSIAVLATLVYFFPLPAVLSGEQPKADQQPGQPTAGKEEPSYKNKPLSHWIGKLKEKDPALRKEAVEAAASLGPQGRAAVPALLATYEEDDSLRLEIVQALGRIGPGAKAALPTLLPLIRDREPTFRAAVVQAICRIGPVDKQVLPALIKVLEGDDTNARLVVAQALQEAGPAAKEATPALRNLLKNKDMALRSTVVQTLGAMGPEAAPALADAAQDVQLGDAVLTAFKKLGPGAKAAVPALSATLKHENKDVRLNVVRILQEIGPDAVPALITALKDREAPVPREAVVALGVIGAGAKAAIPALTETLQDWEMGIDGLSAMSLSKIGPEATKPLLAALKNKGTRQSASMGLQHLGSEAKEAIPTLIKMLKEGNGNMPADQVTHDVSAILFRIGPACVPPLLEAMKDKENDNASVALGNMGPLAAQAVPGLILLLKDKEPQLRLRAVKVLGMLGNPIARPAIPALQEATRDASANVREAATEALKRIE